MSRSYAVVGIILSIFMMIIVSYAIERYGATFPTPIMLSNRQLTSTSDVGEIVSSMSGFIWDYRSLDLVTQTLVLLATATGCTAMLRVIRRKR
jgi:drug/metabolite transporter (DMT)-like permease